MGEAAAFQWGVEEEREREMMRWSSGEGRERRDRGES